MSDVPNLRRLLCRSNFESQNKYQEVKNCRENCVNCPYLLKAYSYQFKSFLLKNSLNCKNSNLIYVAIYEGCQEVYIEENGLSSERANKYLKTTHKADAVSTLASWKTFQCLWRQKVSYVSFFQDSSKK